MENEEIIKSWLGGKGINNEVQFVPTKHLYRKFKKDFGSKIKYRSFSIGLAQVIPQKYARQRIVKGEPMRGYLLCKRVEL